jgi:DNA-binding NarL/FixJ family response regulator
MGVVRSWVSPRGGAPAPGAIRVVIADAQALLRSGLAFLLSAQSDIEVVGQAADAATAVALAERVRPDVVLLDTRLPARANVEVGPSDPGGAGTARRIVRGRADGAAAGPRVVMLSTDEGDGAVRAALRAGAMGFVLKDAAADEVVGAVRAVHRGGGWLDPGVTRGIIEEVAGRPAGEPAAAAAFHRLTPREREVLVLVAHGLTNGEIARHLVVGESTVKTHVQRILFKLHLRDRVLAVVAAYQSGLVHPGAVCPPPVIARSA